MEYVLNLIDKIEKTKKIVKDYYLLSEGTSSLDEHSDYLFECELQMNYCTELQNKLFNYIEENDLEVDYIGFNSSLIWSYFE